MIKLINLLKEINEGKQVGPLYHFTTFTNAIKILQDNALKKNPSSTEDDLGGIRKGISTTRRSYDNWIGVWPEDSNDNIFWIRFKLDGDKLVNMSGEEIDYQFYQLIVFGFRHLLPKLLQIRCISCIISKS
jgi:hypothetical protein